MTLTGPIVSGLLVDTIGWRFAFLVNVPILGFALWVTLGVMRAPADLATVERLDEGQRSLWRVTDARGRLTIFELADGVLVTVSRSEGGRTTSQLRLTRDPNGAVRKASLTDFARSLRLDVDITGREPSEPFVRETWQLR